MKISVIITVYNHERYIAQCLESVLKQKGDFQVEVIVGDDCSTDNTQQIIGEFQKRYPKIVSILSTEKNLGITKNLKRCLAACSGEYIAICEGDDYWTDENKLQKQKDFLDIRKDCSMCFSAILLHYEEKDIFVHHHAQSLLQRDAITMEDLIENNCIGNFSCCMYRTDVVRKLPQGIYDLNFNTDDWIFNMACSQFGKIGFIQEKMSVYRIHSGGVWSGKNIFEQLDYICNHIDVSNKLFDYKYDALFRKRRMIIEDEIVRTKVLMDEQKNDAAGSKDLTAKTSLRTMNIFKTGIQLFKNKIFEMKRRFQLHRR
jgi:glycosyltransferase involved in cell wall biosynthesis